MADLDWDDVEPDSKLHKVIVEGQKLLACTCTIHSNSFDVVNFSDGMTYLRCPECRKEYTLAEALAKLQEEVDNG